MDKQQGESPKAEGVDRSDNMDIARQEAAQAWCTDLTKHKVMDADLCEVFAGMLCNWIDTARHFCRGMEYYRGLLDQCAPYLGEAVYTADDGNRSENPLRAKIPELIAKLAAAAPTAPGESEREAFYTGFSKGWDAVYNVFRPANGDDLKWVRGVVGVDEHWKEYTAARPAPQGAPTPDQGVSNA